MEKKRKLITAIALALIISVLAIPIGLAAQETEFGLEPGTNNVYATTKGKPGKNIAIEAFGEFEDALEGSKTVLLDFTNISWDKGKPQKLNLNELFYVDVTLCTEAVEGFCTESTTYEDYWVYDIAELQEYYWEHDSDSNTLKGLQVKPTTCIIDPSGTADNFCTWEDGTPIDSGQTITIIEIQPTLTLIKTVINDDGGTAVAGDFQAYIDGSPTAWNTAVELIAGVHTVSEDTVFGYAASTWGGDCEPDGTITLALGDNKTCTITNNDQ